jgi:hypothetical protein
VSRYINAVFAQPVSEVVGISVEDLPTFELDGQTWVKVAHGYDAPCATYFCDIMPDCEIGIFYGVIGLTKQVSKWEYKQAMDKLGLQVAANSVAMDIPY